MKKNITALILVIIGTVIAAVIAYYLLPILPDGSTFLRYSLITLWTISAFVLPIVVIYFEMKYETLNKKFVLRIAMAFSALVFNSIMALLIFA
jgi:hypothetical protein